MTEPGPPAQRRRASLLEELRSGDAGPGVRVFVSLALGSLLCGLAVGVPYVLMTSSTVFGLPADMKWGRSLGSVEQALLLAGFLIAAVVYTALLCWVWSRPMDRREFWLAGAQTVGIWLITGALCFGSNVFMPFEEVKLVILAVVCVAAARTLLIWADAWRQHSRGRSAFDADPIGVRCPTCSHDMTDLCNTRCPGCGEALTLDQLLLRQGFEEGT